MAAAGSPGYKSGGSVLNICFLFRVVFGIPFEASYSSLCVMLLNSLQESWWHGWLNAV